MVSRRRGALVLLVSLLVAVAGAIVARFDAATASPNPFASRRLYVDPHSDAADDVSALLPTDPVTATLLTRISTRPQADWLGDWIPTSQLSARVRSRIDRIEAAGSYPVFVVYNLPKRDCKSYSGGGATSAAAYKAWIDAFDTAIGASPVAVILEPDALAQLACLNATDQQTRLALIEYATQELASATVAVYIDAGHADWIAPATMTDRLTKAGVASARGFSLNVSNFGTTADQIAYGREVAAMIGSKRFVIDTSRNGAGPATGISDPWCNPPGRELGEAPTAITGDELVDAFLWIKHPGESDGTCRGGPPAGEWWRDYAIDLAEPDLPG